MRHSVDGRKFGRNTSHRVAMLRNLANSVIRAEQVVTTVQKAKETKRLVDRLVTLGKSGRPSHRRIAFDRTRDRHIVDKLFGDLAKRYEARKGGYTRVLKISDRRWGDGAEMAVLELVDHPPIERGRIGGAPEKAKPVGKEGDVAEPGNPADPFGRFRRLFRGRSKVSGASKSGKMHTGGGAGRKTPAAGGGNKSGGSS